MSERAPQPMTALEFGLVILRVGEAIAVGLAFAKAMGFSVGVTKLLFEFKWSGLRNRKLAAWANPDRLIGGGKVAYQDHVTSFIAIPLDAPLSSIGEFVGRVVRPLFELFNGTEIPVSVIEDLTRRLVERRLS